jgi:hypothetical protein
MGHTSRAAALAVALICLALPAVAEEKPAALPITGIVLFTSGIGYFQHDGSVTGDARMDLDFPTTGINDILKSMILRDLGGGTISGVTFTSKDPITRTLKSFSLDLTQNPGVAQILAQARGRAVEVSAPDPVRGTILSVETQTQLTPANNELTVTILDLLTPQGIRSVPLPQVKGIRFLDPQIQNDLTAALALIATSRDLDRKTVTVHFGGAGTRKVQLGYIQETPVWRMSYRLAVGAEGTPFLQGWAIVENATEGDWKNVNLTLVSGKPIAFTMDLYTSLYVERPSVELDLGQPLKPQTYGMALDEMGGAAAEAAPAPPAAASKSFLAPQAPSPRAAAPELNLSQGVSSAARGAEVGELFQYVLQKPVSLPRRQSALFPIVNQNIGGEKYSIYNPSVDPIHPLNALKLKNSAGLHLMQGPVTVFDGGVYAGDAILSDFPAAAEQFISYAMDLDTEVTAQSSPTPQDIFTVFISKGIVTTTYKLTREKDYNARNRGSRVKSLIIEHPIDASWMLLLPKDLMERSRDTYRFLLPVEAGGSAQLTVVEQRMVSQTASATNLGSDAIAVYMRSSVVSKAVKDALQQLLTLKRKVSDAQAQRKLLEDQVQQIYQEQGRIRENMGHIEQGSDLYNRYVKTLNDQEDRLGTLQDGIDKARADETARQKDVDAFFLGMEAK